MRGFQVDFGRVTEREKQTVRESLDQQLAVVESAGVPVRTLEFFREIPIVIDPALTKTFGQYANLAGRRVVRIRPGRLPSNRPIIMHELLHAYQREVLKVPTPQIEQAYQQAISAEMYPVGYRNAHFLKNSREYFAVIGSIYLFGKRISQPPFTCSIPARSQPEFLAFLADQFGVHECK